MRVIALFNRAGDRLLRTVLPHAQAAATQCGYRCGRCYGSYCVNYYACAPDGAVGPPEYPAPWCWISSPGASGMSYSPCPC
jgi:hypothetical protein